MAQALQYREMTKSSHNPVLRPCGVRPVLFVAPLLACLTAGLLAAPPDRTSEEADRIAAATTVVQEVLAAPDRSIPRSVLDKAEGIAVFPAVKKGGFVIGAQWGRGILSVRSPTGRTWSAPAFLTLTGGSFGLQIGAQEIDLVLVIMDRKGLEQLVRNQFKLGADASVAAGPVGRDAQASTDIQMRAKILSYSRARGLFAGVTISGGTLKQDRDANERFYGRNYSTADIVFDRLGGAPDPVPAWRNAITD